MLPDQEKFGVLYVSNELAQSSFGFESSYNELIIKVKEGTNVETAINELEKKLKKYGVRHIYSKKDQLSNRMITEEIEGNRKSNKVIPVIFLSVAAVIISVMIHRMVKNDRTTIGVFKALGFSNNQILWHYTKFSLTIGFVGSILGVYFGVILSNMIADMYRDFLIFTTVWSNTLSVRLYGDFNSNGLLYHCRSLGSALCYWNHASRINAS